MEQPMSIYFLLTTWEGNYAATLLIATYSCRLGISPMITRHMYQPALFPCLCMLPTTFQQLRTNLMFHQDWHAYYKQTMYLTLFIEEVEVHTWNAQKLGKFLCINHLTWKPTLHNQGLRTNSRTRFDLMQFMKINLSTFMLCLISWRYPLWSTSCWRSACWARTAELAFGA